VVTDKRQITHASQLGRPIRRTKITGLGIYVPPRLLTNADLEKIVDTSSDWIMQRTGIRERHIVDPGVGSSDLGKEAALKALSQAGITPADVEFIIVGTVTPDMMFPSTACLVQRKIGAPHAWGFDLSAGCSAFTFSLSTASELVATGHHDRALVIGADVMSSITDYQDRTTCVLFGDGAGAVVVEPAADDEFGIIDFAHEIDGTGEAALNMPAGGSLKPASHETVEKRMHYIKQDGQTVFKFAVRSTEEICRRVLDRNGITAKDVDLFVCHQANRRIITSAAARLGFEEHKVILNIEKYGNTTAATIPLLWDECVRDGRLSPGDLVLMVAFGAGMTWGASLVRA